MPRPRHQQLADRAWLERQYLELRKGAGTIARELNTPKTTVYDALGRHEIALLGPGMPKRRQAADSH